MEIDYTKHPNESRTPYLNLARTYKEKNFMVGQVKLVEDKILLLERILENPQGALKMEAYRTLNELAAETQYLWPQNKVLRIFFFEGQTDFAKLVLSIAKEWSIYCNIRFVVTENQGESDLRIAFNPKDGCCSYIGTIAQHITKDEPTLNIGYLNFKTFEEMKELRRLVLHEFGHALGLIHEHQSPAFTMDWNVTYVRMWCETKYNWTPEMVEINIFHQYSSNDIWFSHGDNKSIMAYYIPQNFTKNQVVFPLNNDLSDGDKKYIGELYPIAPNIIKS